MRESLLAQLFHPAEKDIVMVRVMVGNRQALHASHLRHLQSLLITTVSPALFYFEFLRGLLGLVQRPSNATVTSAQWPALGLPEVAAVSWRSGLGKTAAPSLATHHVSSWVINFCADSYHQSGPAIIAAIPTENH